MKEQESFKSMFIDTLMDIVKEKIEAAKNEEEAKNIIAHFNELDIGQLFTDALNEFSDGVFKNLKSTMYEEVMSFRAVEQEFLAIQEQKWSKAFTASEALYILIYEASQNYSGYVKTLSETKIEEYKWRYMVVRQIHGRALQEYLEVVTLMKNGFADGACARWRSLYELSVTTSFILKYGEKVARKFYEAFDSNDRYEWARESGVFSDTKRYITFNDIQKNCDLNSDAWKCDYNLANQAVHASAQGTFGRLGDMGTKNVVLVGRSDYGIELPAELSAISIIQITSMFFSMFHNADSVVEMKSIANWLDVIREMYFKTHDEVFPDDEPLWNKPIESNR